MPALSLIVGYFNQIESFELVLPSLELQSFRDFELIIADDGSRTEDTDRLDSILQRSAITFKHLRQEDRGFRKAIILNKAVSESGSDYLMFIDADCILHPRCIEEHHRHKEPGKVIAGRRVDLSPELSAGLSPEKIRKGWLWGNFPVPLFLDGIRNRSRHAENAIYIRNQWLRSRINRKDKGILGSHFSLHRKDFMDVNGFDERFSHYGGEDTDIDYRLRRNGIRIKTLKHIAIQYHIYHPTSTAGPQILEVLESNNRQGMTYTPYGINRRKTS